MADTSSSQHRAQLIREMSKDMNKTRHSSGSSRHSQGATSPEPAFSDFDPENEAMMSTRQLDNNSHQLPELRASAQKYNRFNRPEPDFAINTSAIRRAFPDFSQGSTSSDDGNVSIEVGRGVKKGGNGAIGKLGRPRDYSSHAQSSLGGDSIDFSAPMIGNYEVTSTPPLRQRQSSKKTEDSTRGSLRRDAQVRRASALQREVLQPSPPPAKSRDYGSGESEKKLEEGRRTLASMHARVRDENDMSHISDERPPAIDLTARSTRFGNTKSQQTAFTDAVPTRFSTAQGLMNGQTSSMRQRSANNLVPNQATQQSFMLPDMPNISELVSGVFEDGTPVFARQGKPRASRFGPASQQLHQQKRDYAGVDEIPVPADEQAIFLSLKLLQDKVTNLEKHNAEAENAIEELEKKNQMLESQKNERKRSHHSDSALGTTDSDGGHEVNSVQRKLLIEKNRLESSVRGLQSQVDASKRKTSTAETIIRNITQERDSAVSQLGVAYFTIQQLKVENESLKAENDDLKIRVTQLNSSRENETQEQVTKDEALREKLDPRNGNVRNTMEEKVSQPARSKHTDVTKAPYQINTETPGRNAAQRTSSTRKGRSTTSDVFSRKNALHNESRHGQQNVEIDDSQDNEESVCEPSGKGKGKSQSRRSRPAKTIPDDETSKDLTYLSFLDSGEVAKLRKTLEQERIERKNRQVTNRQLPEEDDAFTPIAALEAPSSQPRQDLPRKSSMKEMTSKSKNQKDVTESSLSTNGQTEQNRRHSEDSFQRARSRRRGLVAENMTSAFILPDITIRNPGTDSQDIPKLTKKAEEILVGLADHNEQNCTVCKRMITNGEDHHHGEKAKETVTIPKPVPVSEREVMEDEEDPTIRPAQEPGVALATVIKGLQDEVDHLKIRLARYQALYNGHDPALGKRRRDFLSETLKGLQQSIDIKSDQIYALYDVLEGQKQDGRQISEEEVEVTLQSIGVDLAKLHLRGGGNGDEEADVEEKAVEERHPWDLESDGDSNEDLPWEGIESTVNTTKSGFAGAGGRKSAVA